MCHLLVDAPLPAAIPQVPVPHPVFHPRFPVGPQRPGKAIRSEVQAQLEGLLGVVAHLQVQPALGHGGVHPGGLSTQVGELLVPVAAALHHRKGGVQKQPKQQVGKLAESAAGGGGKLSVYHNKPVLVGGGFVCLPHRLEEGEGLPRLDEEPVQLGGGQLQVVDLVLLVHHGEAGVPVIKGEALGKDGPGQLLPGLAEGVAPSIQGHPQVKADLSLGRPQGDKGGKPLC